MEGVRIDGVEDGKFEKERKKKDKKENKYEERNGWDEGDRIKMDGREGKKGKDKDERERNEDEDLDEEKKWECEKG